MVVFLTLLLYNLIIHQKERKSKQMFVGVMIYGCCATTGSVSMDTVKSYIEGQRTDEHKRKYVKSGKYKKAIHQRHKASPASGPPL
jgi:hypothetical protein